MTNMIGAILKQVVGRGDIPSGVRQAFRKAKREFGCRGLLISDMMEMLRIALASLPQVFICIDALDECLPKHLPELLELLRDIVQGSPRTRIFLTGSPHIGGTIQRYFAEAVVIPISPSTDDIRNYLEMKLNRDEQPEAMDDDLRVDIVKVILDNMSDMCVGAFSFSILSAKIVCRFLLVSLNIGAVLGEVTIGLRRKKVEKMVRGNGLSDAYTATLARMNGQKGNKSVLRLKVLKWVLYSVRPLRAE